VRGGKGPKRKGNRVEREVLALLKEAGLEAKRVPLSGSAPGYPGDLEVEVPGLGRVVVEVKARKRLALEVWLEGRGLLVLKPDRRQPLAVMPLEALLALIRAANGEGLASSPHPLPRGRNDPPNPSRFPGNGGAKWGQPAPFNRLTTATAPPSPIGQPQPATPVLDGIPGPATAPLNRPFNRSNRTANR